MQYHVPTVTRGAVSGPLWNPLWSRGRVRKAAGLTLKMNRYIKNQHN